MSCSNDSVSGVASRDTTTVLLLPHHEQAPLCTTRPRYRRGRKLTAVKAYTVSDESFYILITGVPTLNLQKELKKLCHKIGNVVSLRKLNDYPSEKFTETFVARFESLKQARVAKRRLDDRNFFGGVFHVCYAPELESVEETRQKLHERSVAVHNFFKKQELEETRSDKDTPLYLGKCSQKDGLAEAISRLHPLFSRKDGNYPASCSTAKLSSNPCISTIGKNNCVTNESHQFVDDGYSPFRCSNGLRSIGQKYLSMGTHYESGLGDTSAEEYAATPNFSSKTFSSDQKIRNEQIRIHKRKKSSVVSDASRKMFKSSNAVIKREFVPARPENCCQLTKEINLNVSTSTCAETVEKHNKVTYKKVVKDLTLNSVAKQFNAQLERLQNVLADAIPVHAGNKIIKDVPLQTTSKIKLLKDNINMI